MSLQPRHQHIGDPAVGDSTHCICHNLKNPPPGGCGRLHCFNSEGQSEREEGVQPDTDVPGQGDDDSVPSEGQP